MTAKPSPPAASDDWFYADPDHQQQGPVSRDGLLDLLQRGVITRGTLVWRQGMQSWRPLAESLDLPPPDMGAIGFASGAPSGVVEKKKLGGCAIAALVGGALLLIAIPVLAILAAIAVPAYQDYTLRAAISGKSAELTGYRVLIAEHHANHQRCPRNGEGDIPAADAFGIDGIDRVDVTADDDGACVMTVTFGDFNNGKFQGENLQWSYYPGDDESAAEWACSSTIEDRYLPDSCRG